MSLVGSGPLVFDTSAVLNFGHRGDLRAVLERFRAERPLVITAQVRAEVRDPQHAEFYAELFASCFQEESIPDVPGLTWEIALDDGERSVLALCAAKGPPWIPVIDEKLGAAEARRLHLPVVGTLGLLREAVVQSWLSEDSALAAIARMRQKGFRVPKLGANDSLEEYLQRLSV